MFAVVGVSVVVVVVVVGRIKIFATPVHVGRRLLLRRKGRNRRECHRPDVRRRESGYGRRHSVKAHRSTQRHVRQSHGHRSESGRRLRKVYATKRRHSVVQRIRHAALWIAHRSVVIRRRRRRLADHHSGIEHWRKGYGRCWNLLLQTLQVPQNVRIRQQTETKTKRQFVSDWNERIKVKYFKLIFLKIMKFA